MPNINAIKAWAPFIVENTRTLRVVQEESFEGDFAAPWAPNLYYMWAGQIGTQSYYVWARSFEGAFEGLVEALDEDGACGFFTALDESDFQEAADDLGIPWDGSFDHPRFDEIRSHAEADLTIIGHTSLRNCEAEIGSGPLYIPSDEWGGEDVVDNEEIVAASRLTMIDNYLHPFLVGDGVFDVATGNDNEEIRILEDDEAHLLPSMEWQSVGNIRPTTGVSIGDASVHNEAFREIAKEVRRDDLAPAAGVHYPPARKPLRRPSPPPPAPPPEIPDEEPHWPAKGAPGRTLTPNEAAIVNWMMRMNWHDDREKAIKHVLKMRQSGHPWITRGAPLDGLDDAMIAVLIQQATPTFLGIPLPSYLRRTK